MAGVSGYVAEEEVAQKIRALLVGELTATISRQWYNGPITLSLSDGWKLFIFADAGYFDYVDWAVAPDGREDWLRLGDEVWLPEAYLSEVECNALHALMHSLPVVTSDAAGASARAAEP